MKYFAILLSGCFAAVAAQSSAPGILLQMPSSWGDDPGARIQWDGSELNIPQHTSKIAALEANVTTLKNAFDVLNNVVNHPSTGLAKAHELIATLSQPTHCTNASNCNGRAAGPVTGTLADNNCNCGSCIDGYSGANCSICADGKFIDTNDGDRCKVKQCTCSTSEYSATGASGTDCPNDGDFKCVSCPTMGAYNYLSNGACGACPSGHECNGSGDATDIDECAVNAPCKNNAGVVTGTCQDSTDSNSGVAPGDYECTCHASQGYSGLNCNLCPEGWEDDNMCKDCPTHYDCVDGVRSPQLCDSTDCAAGQISYGYRIDGCTCEDLNVWESGF